MHEIAGSNAGGKQRPRHAEEVRAPCLEFVDWPWRSEDAPDVADRDRVKTAEGRVKPLQLEQLGLAGYRQIDQRTSIRDILRAHLGQAVAIRRRALLGGG